MLFGAGGVIPVSAASSSEIDYVNFVVAMMLLVETLHQSFGWAGPQVTEALTNMITGAAGQGASAGELVKQMFHTLNLISGIATSPSKLILHTDGTIISGGPPNQWMDPTGSGNTLRYFGPDGKAVKDLHYGHNHGHPELETPHQHDWEWTENGVHPGKPHNPDKIPASDEVSSIVPPGLDISPSLYIAILVVGLLLGSGRNSEVPAFA